METTEKKPKSLIPKKAQIPLVLVGIPLLLYVVWSTANQMGWIGRPPHAKPVQAAKQPAGGAPGGAATQPTATPAPTTPTPARAPGAAPRPRAPIDLSTLRAPSRDPLAELGAQPTPPKPPGPGPAPSGTTKPPPPIPEPTATAAGTGTFPNPTTGLPGPVPPGAMPLVAPVTFQPRPLPPALGATYPMARRGTRAEAGSPSVTLMGTISGSRGSIAVVHPGETARGQYVAPGQTVSGVGSRVESIEAGKVKLGGRGGARELLLRPRPAAPPAKPEVEAAAPQAEEAPDVGGKPD